MSPIASQPSERRRSKIEIASSFQLVICFLYMRDHKDGATTLANTPVNGLLGRQVLVMQVAGSDTSYVRRTLNPAFVEALMGWPTGWTGFAFAATGWFPWLQRMRCELWQLNCWPMDELAG